MSPNINAHTPGLKDGMRPLTASGERPPNAEANMLNRILIFSLIYCRT